MTVQLIDMPATSCFANISMRLATIVGLTQSAFSMAQQAFLWDGEQWEVDFTLPPIKDRAVYAEWQAFSLKLKGRYNYFLLGDPLGRTPRGVGTGSPKVDNAGQIGNSLTTYDWTPGVTGIMKAGDYFQVGDGINARLHMLTQDIDSDTNGDATLVFRPALRSSPALNSAVVVNNAKGAFRLADNMVGWSANPGAFYSFAFSAIEVVVA